MRVYLDDERPAPPGWVLVRWPEEAIALLETGEVEALSLDHDLGDAGDRRTGYAVLQWLEEAVASRGVVPPAVLRVHSANSAARARMLQAIASIRRLAGGPEVGRSSRS
ncbi:MAG: cyclic-phosphate processing receiver domain-containing protein [Planctomycetota bacterium]